MTAQAEAPATGLPPRTPEEAVAEREAMARAAASVPAAVPLPGAPIRIRASAPKADVPREPLFFAVHEDGTETAWTIPVTPPEYLWANALVITVTRSAGAAEIYLMQQMLGMDGWNALLACEGMLKADYRRVVTVVRDKVLGAQESDPNR